MVIVCACVSAGASQADFGDKEERLFASNGSGLRQQSNPGQGCCESRRWSTLGQFFSVRFTAFPVS